MAALIAEARAAGRSIAVLAIDPSSPVTGGAVLGDRVRMQEHASDGGVFIRSMAARGHVGGLAATTAASAAVLAACGFEIVIVETVGTGQSEVEIAALADTTVVLQAPGMGDEVQAIKAGLLEVADIVVVGKADRPGAERTAASLRAMLGPSDPGDRSSARPRPRHPEVLLASGRTGEGIPELLAALDRRAGRLAGDAAHAQAARLARAEAQVTGHPRRPHAGEPALGRPSRSHRGDAARGGRPRAGSLRCRRPADGAADRALLTTIRSTGAAQQPAALA